MEFTSSLAFPGKRLINHLIRTVESPVQDFCSALCYMEPKCVSYNELVASGSPVITKCELNNSTHNEHPQDLKSWTNCRYKGTMVSTFLSYWCFSFILGLVSFDGWLVSYHGQANNITCHLVDQYIKLAQPRVVQLVNVSTVSCFTSMLFGWLRKVFCNWSVWLTGCVAGCLVDLISCDISIFISKYYYHLPL